MTKKVKILKVGREGGKSIKYWHNSHQTLEEKLSYHQLLDRFHHLD